MTLWMGTQSFGPLSGVEFKTSTQNYGVKYLALQMVTCHIRRMVWSCRTVELLSDDWKIASQAKKEALK